jgi:hypothetical protein
MKTKRAWLNRYIVLSKQKSKQKAASKLFADILINFAEINNFFAKVNNSFAETLTCIAEVSTSVVEINNSLTIV